MLDQKCSTFILFFVQQLGLYLILRYSINHKLKICPVVSIGHKRETESLLDNLTLHDMNTNLTVQMRWNLVFLTEVLSMKIAANPKMISKINLLYASVATNEEIAVSSGAVASDSNFLTLGRLY